MLGEIAGEFFIDQGFDDAFYLAITEFGLGLSFELRFRHFDTDNRGQPFTDIFSLKILIVFLELPAVYRIAIDRARERGLKTNQMGPALQGIDVISEGKD